MKITIKNRIIYKPEKSGTNYCNILHKIIEKNNRLWFKVMCLLVRKISFISFNKKIIDTILEEANQ
jgi:hypothetical protein